LDGFEITKKEAYKKFYEECTKLDILPVPVFTGEENNVLCCIGTYINEGLASALSKTLISKFDFTQKRKD
jgi:hypothetical protein